MKEFLVKSSSEQDTKSNLKAKVTRGVAAVAAAGAIVGGLSACNNGENVSATSQANGGDNKGSSEVLYNQSCEDVGDYIMSDDNGNVTTDPIDEVIQNSGLDRNSKAYKKLLHEAGYEVADQIITARGYENLYNDRDRLNILHESIDEATEQYEGRFILMSYYDAAHGKKPVYCVSTLDHRLAN